MKEEEDGETIGTSLAITLLALNENEVFTNGE